MEHEHVNASCEKNENEQKSTESKGGREFVTNILLMLSVVVGATSSGMAMGYPAVLLPQLKSNTSSLYTDDEMGSWIASIFSASMPIGTIISGVMIDKIGRKLTLHIQTTIVIFGWILFAVAQSHAVMLIARFISGLASGLGLVAGQVYIAEVSTPKARGVLSSAPFVSYALGILVVYALGALLEWRIVAGLSTTWAIIALVMYFMYPESHVWLIRQGKIQKATEACIWFRAHKVQNAQREMEELITRYKNEKIEKYNWKYILQPYTLKPLIITTMFNLLQALSGVFIVVFYAADIISNMGIQTLETTDLLVAVLSAVIRMIFSFVSCLLLHYLKRRTLSMLSGTLTSCFSFILAICIYFKVNSYILSICLLSYVAANTVGLLILPGVMIGELFPAKVRGVVGGLSYTLFSMFTFGVTKAYPFLKTRLNMFGLFCLFGVASFLLCVLVYFTLPETKNKTLHEVEDYFMEEGILWPNKRERRKIPLNNISNEKLRALM